VFAAVVTVVLTVMRVRSGHDATHHYTRYTFSTTSADCRFLSQYLHTSAVIQIHCISNNDIQCKTEVEESGMGEAGTHYQGPGPDYVACVFAFLCIICRLYKLTLSGQEQVILQLTFFLV
jgi:hypothetical protein